VFLNLANSSLELGKQVTVVTEAPSAAYPHIVRLWRTKTRSDHRQLLESLRSLENVEILIREEHDILNFGHYLSLLEIESARGCNARYFVFASPNEVNPIFKEWLYAGLLVVGSYQTVYAFSLPNWRLAFTIVAPEGPEIGQFVIVKDAAGREELIIPSEYVLRKVSREGAVEWVVDLGDVFSIRSVDEQSLICEPVVRCDPDDNRRWVIDVATGKVQ
jgi:hypothetical protein